MPLNFLYFANLDTRSSEMKKIKMLIAGGLTLTASTAGAFFDYTIFAPDWPGILGTPATSETYDPCPTAAGSMRLSNVQVQEDNNQLGYYTSVTVGILAGESGSLNGVTGTLMQDQKLIRHQTVTLDDLLWSSVDTFEFDNLSATLFGRSRAKNNIWPQNTGYTGIVTRIIDDSGNEIALALTYKILWDGEKPWVCFWW